MPFLFCSVQGIVKYRFSQITGLEYGLGKVGFGKINIDQFAMVKSEFGQFHGIERGEIQYTVRKTEGHYEFVALIEFDP